MRQIIKKSKKGNNLEIHLYIPLRKKIHNPYMDGEDCGEMDSICGVVDKRMFDYGFAHLIDMSYKGKDNQVSDIFYKFSGSQDEFEKLCKKLNLGIYYY